MAVVSTSTSADPGSRFDVPTFGEYKHWCGGPNHPKDPKEGRIPDGKIDTICLLHDYCYDMTYPGNCQCDREFVRRLMEHEPHEETVEGLEAIRRMVRAFTIKVDEVDACLGFSKGLLEKFVDGVASRILPSGGVLAPTSRLDELVQEEVGGSGSGTMVIRDVTEPELTKVSPNEVVAKVAAQLGAAWWNIGGRDGYVVDYSSKPFSYAKLDGSLALKKRPHTPFFGLTYLYPLNADQRAAVVLEQRNANDDEGYEKLRVFASAAGLALKLPSGGEGGVLEDISTLLTNTEVSYSVAHGFGLAQARADMVFIKPGSTIENRTVSGNLEDFLDGDSLSFYTKFEELELTTDLGALWRGEDVTTSNYSKFPIGLFYHKHRRPTDDYHLDTDYYYCPTCSGGNRYFLFDADYASKGLTIGGYGVNQPKVGESGTILRTGGQLYVGLDNEITLHDSSMELYQDGLAYVGVHLELDYGHQYAMSECDGCSYQWAVGVSVDTKTWDGLSTDISDSDSLFTVYGNVQFQFQ